MKLAREISSAGNLGLSIRETLETLRRLPAPSTAKPKSKQKSKSKSKQKSNPALAQVEPDNAAVIEDLETELYDAQERVAIMEEAVDPKSRKAIDKINNQAALIRTLKASVAKWQSKHADARRENGALKRRIRALENQKGARAI